MARPRLRTYFCRRTSIRSNTSVPITSSCQWAPPLLPSCSSSCMQSSATSWCYERSRVRRYVTLAGGFPTQEEVPRAIWIALAIAAGPPRTLEFPLTLLQLLFTWRCWFSLCFGASCTAAKCGETGPTQVWPPRHELVFCWVLRCPSLLVMHCSFSAIPLTLILFGAMMVGEVNIGGPIALFVCLARC
jgi:hypothetical protein